MRPHRRQASVCSTMALLRRASDWQEAHDAQEDHPPDDCHQHQSPTHLLKGSRPMFSISWDFEELQVEIDGVRCGWFNGTAELIEDSGSFYVASITLDGEKMERTPGKEIPKRTNCRVQVERTTWLFDALAASIYGSRDAEETFFEELAMERAA